MDLLAMASWISTLLTKEREELRPAQGRRQRRMLPKDFQSRRRRILLRVSVFHFSLRWWWYIFAPPFPNYYFHSVRDSIVVRTGSRMEVENFLCYIERVVIIWWACPPVSTPSLVPTSEPLISDGCPRRSFPSHFFSQQAFTPGECQVSLKSPPPSPPPPFSRMRTSTHDLYHHHVLLFLPRPGKGESVQKFLSSGPCAHCRNGSSPHSAEHNFQSTLARLWQFRQAWASCTARTVTGCGAGKPRQLWHAFSQKSSLDGPGGAPFSLQSAHRPVLSIQSRRVLAPTSSEKAPSKPRKRCWDSKRKPTKCYVALNMS